MLGRNAYPASASDLDGVEILLHHHQYLHHHHQQHPDAFSGLYLAANAPAAFEGGEASAAAPARKQAAKKDRHSKIHTAQGPRDRRVRLSIGIARKFFDLQEMLGFDKPSKTLDWLLTKSKAAIKELMQTRSAASSPEMISSDQTGGDSSSRKSGTKSTIAKESRAKARARARERTLEKMCIKQLNHPSSSSSFEQCRNNQHLDFLQLSSNPSYHHHHHHHLPFATHQDLIEESIVIKRKNKSNNPSSLLGFHQNLVLNSNYTLPSANTANDNWDVFAQSNLHAAFDHHKFFNSSSNI